ncbi:MAG TPA: hypothetical protein VHL79_04585 [Ramlibacter sp.]|jgi:hypothetical protein|nr:hypothetical protein [Ramlibacter sp.]
MFLKRIVHRVLRERRPRHGPEDVTDAMPLEPGGGVEAEYERIVRSVLRRWGAEDCVSVRIVRTGEGSGELDSFVAMLQILGWTGRPVLRLLVGLPFLEKKVAKAVRAHWVHEVSEFRGLWLRAPERISEAQELRSVLDQLAGKRRPWEPGSGS